MFDTTINPTHIQHYQQHDWDEVIAKNQQLDIDLSSISIDIIDEAHWQLLSSIVTKNPRVNVTLSCHSMTYLYALESETSWQHLRDAFAHSPQLTINYPENHLTMYNEPCWQQQCAAFAHSPRLTLNLSGNNLYLLGIAFWKPLCDVIANNPQLTIDLSNNKLHKLDADCRQLLYDAIANNPQLTIDLSNNKLYKLDAGYWHLLCDAIANNPQLTINLSNNKLYKLAADCWQLLCDAIAKSPRLAINLSENKLDKLDITRREQLLKTPLAKSDFRSIKTGNEELDKAIDILAKNKTLAILHGLTSKCLEMNVNLGNSISIIANMITSKPVSPNLKLNSLTKFIGQQTKASDTETLKVTATIQRIKNESFFPCQTSYWSLYSKQNMFKQKLKMIAGDEQYQVSPASSVRPK